MTILKQYRCNIRASKLQKVACRTASIKYL